MADLTPFGQSLQAQGGASALLRLQGYTPGTREYKRAYDVLYNLSTGRQKGTEKYANIRAGVEQRAERQQAQRERRYEYRPGRLCLSGYFRFSTDFEYRSSVCVNLPPNFDIDYYYSTDEPVAYAIEQFIPQLETETGAVFRRGNKRRRGLKLDESDLESVESWLQ